MSVPIHLIEKARESLAKSDEILRRANEVVPRFEWHHREGGFSGLVSLIVEQQVSVAAASSIWNKLEIGLGGITVAAVLRRSVDELKSFGLSAPKARYVKGIAEAHQRGDVDLEELRRMNDDEACEKLLALNGIGRWTAEAYLMGCEARTDVFPAADIALQEAVRILDGAATRPSTEELYKRAEKWRPFRSVAAHLLWSYYTGIKSSTIPMPQGVPPLVKTSRGKKKQKAVVVERKRKR